MIILSLPYSTFNPKNNLKETREKVWNPKSHTTINLITKYPVSRPERKMQPKQQQKKIGGNSLVVAEEIVGRRRFYDDGNPTHYDASWSRKSWEEGQSQSSMKEQNWKAQAVPMLGRRVGTAGMLWSLLLLSGTALQVTGSSSPRRGQGSRGPIAYTRNSCGERNYETQLTLIMTNPRGKKHSHRRAQESSCNDGTHI